jgi:hypothetical protein
MHSIELRKVYTPIEREDIDFPASTSRVDKQILNTAITIVTTHAESNGLTNLQIGRLVDVLVLPDGLDRGSVSRIVGSLFPEGKVEEDIAVKILSCLGLGSERAPLQTQVFHDTVFVNVDVIIEMASHGLPVFDFSYPPASTLWCHIQLSELCLTQVLIP